MSTMSGQRGTPKGKSEYAQGSGGTISGIPRPKLESTVSDAQTSLSASRAKTSKRDEVWASITCKMIFAAKAKKHARHYGRSSRAISARSEELLDEHDRHEKHPLAQFWPSDRTRPCRSGQTRLSPRQLR